MVTIVVVVVVVFLVRLSLNPKIGAESRLLYYSSRIVYASSDARAHVQNGTPLELTRWGRKLGQ